MALGLAARLGAAPERLAASTFEAPVSTVDLLPTICELAGVEVAKVAMRRLETPEAFEMESFLDGEARLAVHVLPYPTVSNGRTIRVWITGADSRTTGVASANGNPP